jgi:hypothetical protein
MLYLSQRKISQITRMQDGSNLDGHAGGYPAGQGPAAMLGPAGPYQSAQPQPEPEPVYSPPNPASGAFGKVVDGGRERRPEQQPAGGPGYSRPANSRRDEYQGPSQQQQQPNQQSPQQPPQQTPQTSNEIKISVGIEGIKLLNAEITETKNKIEQNEKSLKSRLMIAAFLGFCSIAIGIGANTKYGAGNMSAFESLAGKHGAGGTAENLWNSGSTTDPLRGINYGFAVAGFVLPILGTLLSLMGAFYNYNQIKIGVKNNKLRQLAIEGFSLPKTIQPDIHPNHVKLKEKIVEISSAPTTEFSPSLAVQLARAHRREMKYLEI